MRVGRRRGSLRRKAGNAQLAVTRGSGGGRERGQLAAVLICVAVGLFGLFLALRNGGLVAWLLAAFVLLAARVHLRPRPTDLRRVARALAALLGAMALVAAGVVAIWESGEVIVLRQTDERGEPFSTRLWVVDFEGVPSLLVRPPSEQRRIALLRDHPRVEVARGDRSECRRAVLAPISDETRAELTRLYREKYGPRVYFAGRFVGFMLGGPSGPREPEILLRLEPCTPEGR